MHSDPVLRHKISAAKLARYFHNDLSKMRHVFSLSFYLMCVILLSGLISANRVAFFTSTAPFYYQTHAGDILQASTFTAATSFDDFFPWLTASLSSGIAVSINPNVSTKLLEIVQLRQIRVTEKECASLSADFDGIDPLSQAALLDSPCVGDPTGSMPPYFGRGNAFPRRSDTNNSAVSLIASFHDLGDGSLEYVALVSTASLAGMLSTVSRIQNNAWLDRFTSCVSVDVITYFADAELSVVTSFIMERTTTGLFQTQVQSATFSYFNTKHELIALDALIFLCCVILLFFLCVDLHEKYIRCVLKVNPSRLSRVKRVLFAAGFWEYLSLGLICCVFTGTGMRFQLWILGANTTEADGVSSYNFAVSAYDQYATIFRIYCIGLVFVALRVLYSFRYVAGLSKITNALRRTAAELGRLAFIYVVLLIVFTISACMLFGSSVFGMRTFTNAMAFLLIALVSASIDDDNYYYMRHSKGLVTDVYLTLLFMVFWMMLLNLVIAVISTAFLTTDMVDETELDGVLTLASKFVTFRNHDDYAIDRMCKEEGAIVSSLSPSQKLAHCNLRRLPAFTRRLSILKELRAWRLACYLDVAKKSLSDFHTFTFDEALAFLEPRESILRSSHLNASTILYRTYAYDFKIHGALLSAVDEATDLQQHMMKRTFELQHRMQMAIVRNVAAPPARAPSTRQRGHSVAERIHQSGARLRVAGESLPPVPAREREEDDDADVRGAQRTMEALQRRRARSVVENPTWTGVAELDSESDPEDEDAALAIESTRAAFSPTAASPSGSALRGAVSSRRIGGPSSVRWSTQPTTSTPEPATTPSAAMVTEAGSAVFSLTQEQRATPPSLPPPRNTAQPCREPAVERSLSQLIDDAAGPQRYHGPDYTALGDLLNSPTTTESTPPTSTATMTARRDHPAHAPRPPVVAIETLDDFLADLTSPGKARSTVTEPGLAPIYRPDMVDPQLAAIMDDLDLGPELADRSVPSTHQVTPDDSPPYLRPDSIDAALAAIIMDDL